MGRILFVALLLIAGSVSAAAPTEPGIYNPDTSTPTTMYFHINGFQQFPINTQQPDDRYADTVTRGSATHSGCVEDPTGNFRFTSQSYHTWYGYSSPSIVEYDADNNGEPIIHQERGLAYDVELDTDTPAMFSWFLEGKSAIPADLPFDPDQVPTPMPQVVVRATIRHGDEISPDNSAFNQGQIIAIGQSMPTDLLGAMTTDNEHVTTHTVDGRYVYEFRFPLEYEVSKIVREEGYNIRVDAFMQNDYCAAPEDKNSLMLDYARVHTSSQFRPHLEWSIMNPLIIEVMHPQFVGDDLVVHTQINSPWGSYDVLGDLAREQQLGFDITGPSPVMTLDRIVVDHTKGHGPEYHFKPVIATWMWDYQADQAKNGIYKVTLHAQNDQQTAEAYGVSTFQIGNGEVCYPGADGKQICDSAKPTAVDAKSPGVPTFLLVAGLLGLALVRRR